jgi:hypothetical protein
MSQVAAIRALCAIGARGFGVGSGAFIERREVGLRNRKELERVHLLPGETTRSDAYTRAAYIGCFTSCSPLMIKTTAEAIIIVAMMVLAVTCSPKTSQPRSRATTGLT